MKNFKSRYFYIIGLIGAILLLSGCAQSKGASFPVGQEDLQKAIDKHQLGWSVVREIAEDHEFSKGGYGKAFHLEKDGRSLGVLTTIQKDEMRVITLVLFGRPRTEAGETFENVPKENWREVLLFLGEIYGSEQYTDQAYEKMMSYYEKNKTEDTKTLLFSEEYDGTHYNTLFTEKMTITHTSGDSKPEEITITYDDQASINISNKAGNDFYLNGIKDYQF
ncbi:MAG: hypothetical protein Q4A75_07480 [Peptostreptococcaceae bacterium]|nr:hypothetical protein [Peptostreptococcaceae bacterium]